MIATSGCYEAHGDEHNLVYSVSMYRNNRLVYTLFHFFKAVLVVDDRHVAFCEYNGSVARISSKNKFLLEIFSVKKINTIT
jgi:hypothetical protein